MLTLNIQLIIISYTILAPTVLPKGFVDAKEASFKVVKEIALDENDYRFGHTKVLHTVLIHACTNNTLIEASYKLTPLMQITYIIFCTILELDYFYESFQMSITILTFHTMTFDVR